MEVLAVVMVNVMVMKHLIPVQKIVVAMILIVVMVNVMVMKHLIPVQKIVKVMTAKKPGMVMLAVWI
jgi:hypothetical protein